VSERFRTTDARYLLTHKKNMYMADEIECPRKEHSAWSWFQILESLRSD